MTAGSSSPTVVSLFSGLGGLDLGFEWGGFRIIWANDILPHAVESYERNLGIRPILADIERVDPVTIPPSDVVIGGPPCQSFSLVGQRRQSDHRGELVFRFLEAVKMVEPKAFAMENVPGMAASRINGKRLPDILEDEFTRIGYHVTRVSLMATDYLVPQRRKRIVILGSKRRKPKKPNGEAFARECYGIRIDGYDLSSKAAIADLGPSVTKGERANYSEENEPSIFAELMRRNNGKDFSMHECPRMSKTDRLFIEHIPPGGNYRDIPDRISTERVMKFKKTGGRTTTYGRLRPDQPAYTINTYFRRPNVGCNFHYSEPRLITAREAMRFQSIPDRFELASAAKDKQNALIGNAVPPLMAHAIAWSLNEAL